MQKTSRELRRTAYHEAGHAVAVMEEANSGWNAPPTLVAMKLLYSQSGRQIPSLATPDGVKAVNVPSEAGRSVTGFPWGLLAPAVARLAAVAQRVKFWFIVLAIYMKRLPLPCTIAAKVEPTPVEVQA
jgi:hypothetical protein